MGRRVWEFEDSGYVEQHRDVLAYQCLGVASGKFCYPIIHKRSVKYPCTYAYGQYDGNSVPEQNGRTRSSDLVTITQDMFSYTLSKAITLTAEHLPGVQNVEADAESRDYRDWSNWRLHPNLFKALNKLWGPFEVDLFADRLNSQLPMFYSWKPDPAAMAIDAFQQDWNTVRGYAFPPFALVGRCLAKIAKEQADLILVTPAWQSQSWYPRIMHMVVDHPVLFPPEKDLLQSPAQENHRW